MNGTAFTDRQKGILQLLARGQSSKEVAAELSLSVKTVNNHRATIVKKLEARNTPEALAKAIQHGLIT